MEYKYGLVECMIRVLTGAIFIIQANDRFKNIQTDSIYDFFRSNFEKLKIPRTLAEIFIHAVNVIELCCGILLMAGLYRNWVLLILLAEMCVISVFFTLIQPMWDMKYLWPRLVLVLFQLLIPDSWSIFSLDNIIK